MTKPKTITIILLVLFFACKTKIKTGLNNTTPLITYEVKVDSSEGFENNIMPWISIKNPETEIKGLVNADDIVVNKNEAILIIDYPLNKPIEINIKSKDKSGFRRSELIEIISKIYHKIYDEEESSATVKTIPIEERKGIINRNTTDGKYGIWGHDIDDLDLSGIIVRETKSGQTKLELLVES